VGAADACALELSGIRVGCDASAARARIVHPETRAPLPDGAVGEVWVAGASVCTAGYWGLPDETAAAFGARLAGEEAELAGETSPAARYLPPPRAPRRSYLRTGDLAFVEGGVMFMAGRIKDVLIVRGRNLHANDIEASLSSSTPLFHRPPSLQGRTYAWRGVVTPVSRRCIVGRRYRRAWRATSSAPAARPPWRWWAPTGRRASC